MEHLFPTICVDNFLDNVEEVLKLAESLDYHSSILGKWPGKRTESINLYSEKLFNYILSDVFGLFYNYDFEILKWNAEMYFQKTKPYDISNKGWIHNDIPSLFSGVIYLTKDNDPNSGTSIFSCLDESKYLNCDFEMNFLSKECVVDLLKKKLYINDEVDVDQYHKVKESYEKNFVETIRYDNVFNRLVAYDAGQFHRANSFNGSKDNERLTLVFFVNKLNCQTVPLKRNK